MSKDYNPAERFLNGLFGWRGVNLPRYEPLVLPRDTRDRTPGARVDWQPENGADVLSHRRDLGRVPSDGVAPGWAIQLGDPERLMRISVGRPEYGENRTEEMPRKSWVHSSSWPATDVAADRSGAIVDPVTSWQYQFWQWRVYKGVGLDAATFAVFNERGERVHGNGGSALHIPVGSVLLVPDSFSRPHLTDIYVSEYQTHDILGRFADGQLDRGPQLGLVLVLSRDSETFERNMALGGECAQLAEMHASKGVLVGDRAGGVENREGLSATPKAPAIRVSAHREWKDTNIKEFQFRLSDYVAAVEQGWEFRMPGDPHTPFVSEPVVDPRIAQVEAAHGVFEDTIIDLGLDSGNTKYLVGLNDQTMGEAVRLIEQQGGQ